MKKTIAITVALVLICAMLAPALAEGAIKRIGTLQMLNMNESDYAGIQKLRAYAGEMLNAEGIPAEHPYYDGMIDENPEIIYFDTLNDMVMALNANQIDAIDLNRTTAEYLCASNDDLVVLLDYQDEDNILTDFLFNSLMGFDFSMMLKAEKQDLTDELTDALYSIDEDALDEMGETYIAGATNGEIPTVEMPVFEGAETIRVAVTGDLPPMDYVSPDGRPSGFNVAILAELGSRLGVNFELVPISAAARSMALASDQVDAVFWSRSCMGVQEFIDEDIDWTELLDIEDEEDAAMLDLISNQLVPAFDYVGYAGKDIPEGMIVTGCYYTDSTVLVARK